MPEHKLRCWSTTRMRGPPHDRNLLFLYAFLRVSPDWSRRGTTRCNPVPMCDLMGARCSHESSKFVFVSAMSRIRTVLFRLPGHLLVLCFLQGVHLHRVPELWLEKCRKWSPRHVCGCGMRVLLVPSRGFLVLSSLFLRHGSQIQSTIHQLETHWLSRHSYSRLRDCSGQAHSAAVGSRQEAPVSPDSPCDSQHSE